MPTINDITVRLDGWVETERSDAVVQWEDGEDAAFSLNFFPLAPDIHASLADVSAVRCFYRDAIVSSGLGLIACDVIEFVGLQGIELVAKAPMEPTGFAFLGTITLPFRDCSYVLKHQALEGFPTGMRESVVMMLECPEPDIDEATGKIMNWAADPYDQSLEYEIMRNRADDLRWDEEFPDHALSKLRRNLSDLRSIVSISDELYSLPKFTW